MKTNRYIIGFDKGVIIWGSQPKGNFGEGAMHSLTLVSAKKIKNREKDFGAKIYKLVEVKICK